MRILFACAASLLLYIATFAAILDRPLSFGFLRNEIDARLLRGAVIAGPKLVILAGSNGPYSHRCTTIEPLLHMPCVNGGVAVGIGLDYLFARWQPLLHPGDVVYLPMEEAQYVHDRAATALGPDAAIMLRHDRATLARLSPRRWVSALFVYDLRGYLMALIETALVAGGFHDPRAAATGESNAWGDHIGHTVALAAPSIPVLAAAEPYHPSAAQIRDGYGSALIVGFADWASAHGVRVIGGLPAGFSDLPISDAAVAAIREIYAAHRAWFLELPNRSRYPRTAFFDSAEHLNETWQQIHSAAVAHGLAGLFEQSAPVGRAGYGADTGSTPVMVQDVWCVASQRLRAAAIAATESSAQPTLHTAASPAFAQAMAIREAWSEVQREASSVVLASCGASRNPRFMSANTQSAGFAAWSRQRLSAVSPISFGISRGQGSRLCNGYRGGRWCELHARDERVAGSHILKQIGDSAGAQLADALEHGWLVVALEIEVERRSSAGGAGQQRQDEDGTAAEPDPHCRACQRCAISLPATGSVTSTTSAEPVR